MDVPGAGDWEVVSASTEQSLTIVVAGRIGTGKSALVNALIGGRKEEAKESSKTLGRETDQLAPYKSKKDERITIWDSPGLEFVRTPEELEEFVRQINEMEEKIGSLNLLLYCTKMDEHRLRQGDFQSIRVLTKAFGESIWKNAVFVLTFANELQVPVSKAHMDKEEYFKEKLGTWKYQLQQEVKSLGVSYEIPVIQAGNYKKLNLLGRQDWLSEFWDICLDHEAMKDGAQPIQLKANTEYLEAMKEKICSNQPSVEIPAKCVESNRSEQESVGPVALVGGISGFAVGAVVGGTVVGAVTGAGLVGGAAVLAYRWYTSQRQCKNE